MNFKSKAFGFIAGTVLTLSLASGAMADTGDTEIDLVDGAPCTTGTVTGATIDFGTATWNGTAYTSTSTPTGSLTVPVTNGVFDVQQCSVSITVGNLLGLDGDGDFIAGSAVTLTDGGSNTVTGGSGNIIVLENSSVVLTATLSLTGVTVEPDTYQGTITVGNAAAS